MTEQGAWSGAGATADTNPSDLVGPKRVVLDYYAAFDDARSDDIATIIDKFTTDAYTWRGVHPFHELQGATAVAEAFWSPFLDALGPVQRRADVFLAGVNVVDDGESTWVCQMGHLMGMFDRPWLDIPPTHRMCFLRYAEFHRVEGGLIADTSLFVDIIGVMKQAGQYPLAPSTGVSILHPGPATNDGLLFGDQDVPASAKTMALVHSMGSDLNESNRIALETGDNRVPREVLERAWQDDMIWWGPEGIGSTYTIDRYQHQHQFPFRFNLLSKRFNGHVARFAEGNYACFFGWPNLTNVSQGGFLGQVGSGTPADMRVVDVYRRDGDLLAENWVFIDLPHWLNMQGLDVLERMRQLLGIEEF